MSEPNEPLTPMDLRERAGLSQMQVAVALGKTPTTVSNWERRLKQPEFSLQELKRLIDLYDCTFSEFLEAFGVASVKISMLDVALMLDLCECTLDEFLEAVKGASSRKRPEN